MKDSEFRFLGYRVCRATFSLEDEFPSGEEKLSHEIKIENKIDDNDKRLTEVILNVSVKNEKGTMSISVVLKGAFKGSDQMTDEQFEKLGKQNGPAILFPYVRAIISTYTAQANIPPVIIPSINFSN